MMVFTLPLLSSFVYSCIKELSMLSNNSSWGDWSERGSAMLLCVVFAIELFINPAILPPSSNCFSKFSSVIPAPILLASILTNSILSFPKNSSFNPP